MIKTIITIAIIVAYRGENNIICLREKNKTKNKQGGRGRRRERERGDIECVTCS